MATGVSNGNGAKKGQNGRGVNYASPVRLAFNRSSLNDLLAQKPEVYEVVKRIGVDTRNRLYFGDNRQVLLDLLGKPSIAGKVKFAYLDPPFATGSAFHSRKLTKAYEDVIEGAAYVEQLYERLLLLRELMSESASLYLHLDSRMIFQAKLLADEIFGESAFKNLITRKKCNPKNFTRRAFGNVSDYILFYAWGDYTFHKPHLSWSPARMVEEYQCVDHCGRRYKKVPVHAPGIRHGETGKPWRGKLPPPGKHWQYPPTKLEEMDKRGEIYWSPRGNPRRKLFFDQSAGVPVQDIWMDVKDAHNQNIHVSGYPTEKNLTMLMRMIESSTDPGDLIIDPFCGSGTTLEAASLLSRDWIGIDNGLEAITTTMSRFQHGLAPMGDFVTARLDKGTPLFDGEEDIRIGLPRTRAVEPDYQLLSSTLLRNQLSNSLVTFSSVLADLP